MEIFIPWRDVGCKYRQRHFFFLKEYYSKIGNVTDVDSSYKIFNRSNARNECVKKAKTDTFLIIDADNFIDYNQIIYGMKLSSLTKKIIRPFSSIHYLNKKATEKFYKDIKNFSPEKTDHEYMFPEEIRIENSGGAYIVVKKIWEDLGGMNENFIGWGGEDLEFNLRYKKQYGDQLQIKGPNYNLYHPNDRTISEHNIDIIMKKSKGL